MQEVEVKLAVAVPATLRARLKSLGAVPQPVRDEEDLFFQHPCRDLVAADEAFRARRSGDGWELTYKGPRRDAAVKVREEYNLAVADDPTPLLAMLGFRPVARLRKRRESWRLGAVTVTLDAIEGLGTFCEVEVLAEDVAAAQEQVEDVVRRLGLVGADRYPVSYLEMALSAGAAGAQKLPDGP